MGVYCSEMWMGVHCRGSHPSDSRRVRCGFILKIGISWTKSKLQLYGFSICFLTYLDAG